MSQDKIQALLHARASADQELERLRARVTILFSDIKGSTAYFEKKGDLQGLAMVHHHNSLLIPVIEDCTGRVVKTIGDAIMARFDDPVAAIQAAVGMQRALETDRTGKPNEEQIHIRIGLHTGLGYVKEDDVYGDVVNAASRVQHQAKPDQILITEVLLEAAKSAGVQYAKLGRAELRGKDEQLDVYALAWSDSNIQLIEELESQYENRLKESKRLQDEIEEEFENARAQWRTERRRLASEIEDLEQAIEDAKSTARFQASDELHSEIRFQLEEARRARTQAEQDYAFAQAKWERERAEMKQHLAAMQASTIDAMERSNNPTRLALAVREQVEARIAESKHDWMMQWDAERRRLNAENERLRNARGKIEEKKDAARRALLQKLGKLPGSAPPMKTADQWERDFEQARIEWEQERDQLKMQARNLEREVQKSTDGLRSEIFQELRAQYKPKIEELRRERERFERDLNAARVELSQERERLSARILELERAIPEAQEATRKQVAAEIQSDFDARLDEINRVKTRAERRFQDETEEWEAELRRARKQIAELEEQLKDARGAAFKAQRIESSNR